MIQRPYFLLTLAFLARTLYTLIHVLFIYLYYTYFILVYYTSTLYYTLIKNIYDPTSYFTLDLYPTHCFHDGELLKLSRALVFLESTRSGVMRMLKVTKSSMRSGTYFILKTISTMKLF